VRDRERERFTPKDIGLKSDSFMAVTDAELLPRVNAIVMAGQKVGKDHWALAGMPEPIVLFNIDQGLEGVVEKFIEKKRITVAGMPGSKGKGKYPHYHFARPAPERGQGRRDEKYLARIRAAATPIFMQFTADFNEFLESKARSGIIDTGGALNQLAKFAFIGLDKGRPGTDDPYGQKTGELNSIMQGLYAAPYNDDNAVIWLDRTKEEWVNSEPSGTMEPEGNKGAPYEVQMTLLLKKKVRKSRGEVEVERSVTLVDSRIQIEVDEGTVWGDGNEERPKMSFARVMADIFGTDLEAWK